MCILNLSLNIYNYSELESIKFNLYSLALINPYISLIDSMGSISTIFGTPDLNEHSNTAKNVFKYKVKIL